jgi:hypothetical protein
MLDAFSKEALPRQEHRRSKLVAILFGGFWSEHVVPNFVQRHEALLVVWRTSTQVDPPVRSNPDE